jgi:hypothetical protein
VPKKPKLTATQRIQRARIAALTRWSREDPAASAARGQAGLLAKFVEQVDPDRVLPEAERIRRAEAARRAHMQRLAFRSSKVRARRRPATVDTRGRLVQAAAQAASPLEGTLVLPRPEQAPEQKSHDDPEWRLNHVRHLWVRFTQ